jgi:hypothetical protein
MWLQQFLNKHVTSKIWINFGSHIVISINVCCNLRVKPGSRERERVGYMENLATCMSIQNEMKGSRIL